MKVDKILIKQLRNIHQELPVLTLQGVLDTMELINSEDEDISSTGQSMIYLSNFFEIPETCRVIVKHVKNKNTDMSNLEKILDNLSDEITDYDRQMSEQLKEKLNELTRYE
jgi:hypothetical protein